MFSEDVGETVLREIKVSTAPAAEVIDLDYFKNYAKIPPSAKIDDELTLNLIKNAIKLTEAYVDKSFITQTLIAYWDSFGKEVHIPRGPHQSITTVERIYKGVSTVLVSGTDYYTSGEDYLSIYPTTVYRGSVGRINYNLKVTYIAGFGTDQNDVPEEYVDLICRQALIDYERGEASKQLSGEAIKKSSITLQRANWF